MENFVNSKTVIGDPITFGDIILVPLVEVTFFGGSGLDETKTALQKGGGGLGGRITPVAVIVIVDGAAQLINVKNQESVNKLIDMIPGILSKFNLDSLFESKTQDNKSSSIEN
jgi:uncharacterized spore protein YtfJ